MVRGGDLVERDDVEAPRAAANASTVASCASSGLPGLLQVPVQPAQLARRTRTRSARRMQRLGRHRPSRLHVHASGAACTPTATGTAAACSARAAEVAGAVLPSDLSLFAPSPEAVNAAASLTDGSAAAAEASAADGTGGARGCAGSGSLARAPRCTASVRSSETRADAELSRSSSRLVGCRLIRKVVAWRFERMSVWKMPERITSSRIVTAG